MQEFVITMVTEDAGSWLGWPQNGSETVCQVRRSGDCCSTIIVTAVIPGGYWKGGSELVTGPAGGGNARLGLAVKAFIDVDGPAEGAGKAGGSGGRGGPAAGFWVAHPEHAATTTTSRTGHFIES